MKQKPVTTNWLLLTLLILISMPTICFSQKMVKMCNLTPAELQAKFNSLSGEAGMKVLQSELTGRRFSKLSTEGTSYGFTGTFSDETGKVVPVEFYAFDYYNRSTHQMGSIIWRNNGKSIYKAYLTFKAGEKDFGDAMETSVEMYVDGNNKIQKASSFGRCWKRCVFKNCVGWCVGAISICAAATATLAIASAGPTAGIGVGAAVAIFAGCAGVTCGTCFGVCAVGCF